MIRDRTDAGRRLAELVADRLADAPYSLDASATVVMGLPRGGIPVAALVAEGLGVPLDVLVIRKVGVLWRPEVAMGAVGENGAVVRRAPSGVRSGHSCHGDRAARVSAAWGSTTSTSSRSVSEKCVGC